MRCRVESLNAADKKAPPGGLRVTDSDARMLCREHCFTEVQGVIATFSVVIMKGDILMTRKFSRGMLASALAFGMALTGTAFAQDGTTGGLSASARAVAPSAVSLDRMRPSIIVRNALAASGGVGLRNRASGAIELGGLDPLDAADVNMKRAFIYWYVIVNGTPPADIDKITVQRVGPDTSRAFTVTGDLIGEGASPCWGGGPGQAYRAELPRARLVNGNGTYLVTLPDGVPGRTDGASPWAGSPLPAYNGASIVAIAEGFGNVMVYDGAPMTAAMFSDRLISRLVVPSRLLAGGNVILHSINSDGQAGSASNMFDSKATATERTILNGTAIGGPTSDGRDGLWNGASGGRVAQLWDNAVKNITTPLGTRRVARIVDIAGADCLTPVARVIESR